MKTITKKEWLVFIGIYAILLIMYAVVTPKFSHQSDAFCWARWSYFGRENGLGKIYECGTDYMPLYQYVLYFFGKWQYRPEELFSNLYVLKNVTLLFEMIIGFQLFRLKYLQTKNFDKALLHSLFYMLNICVLYNSVIWGQVDGIFSSFVLLSVLFAYQGNILLSVLFYIIALNFKLQAIIFFPLIGVLLLPLLLKKSNIKTILATIISAVFLQVLILLPFILGGTLQLFYKAVFGSFDRYAVVSMNAFNFWSIVLPNINLMEVQDNIIFKGLSFKTWGLLLFLIGSSITFFPILKHLFFVVLKKHSFTFSLEKLMHMGALIPLLFFYCNTEMHERYSHPAFAFLAVIGVIYNKPFAYILGSIAYFLNLEFLLQYFELVNYKTTVFHPTFIAILYGIIIIYLIISLYKIKDKEQTFLPNHA